MELVYLWVEDYKNIHHQGFNFSSRFRCDYNPDTNKLIICDKNNPNCKDKEECKEFCIETYIENFFGKNINITAIVGKNGSGKSGILEALHFILNDKNNVNFDYILVYKMDDDNDEPNYISNIEITTIATEVDIKNTECHIYTNDLIEYKNRIGISKESIVEKLINSSLESNFKLTTFMYIPEILEVTANVNNIFNKTLDDMSQSIYDIYDENMNYEDNNKRARTIEDILYRLKSDIESDYHKFLLILFLDVSGYDNLNDLEDIENLKVKLKESEIEYLEEDVFNKYFSAVNEKKDISELDDKEKDIYLRYSYLFEFDFIDNKSRRYNDLSHGERTIFGQFLSIYSISRYSPYTNSFIYLLDEAELSLHPNWQKQYIHEMVYLLKKIEKKFNIIFATHSPFLLSDIPKQNIKFLDTDKEGKCKVVDGLSQTFGANIHTLLSESFFMSNGLMGKFAKNKIQEIMDFLNDKKTINEISTKEKYIKQVIESVGEPFLKRKLLDMYYTKYKDESLKEIRKQELLSQKRQIEEELKRL